MGVQTQPGDSLFAQVNNSALKFVEFRCPNTPKSDSDFVCSGVLAGPEILTIALHDFKDSPYVDLRYCHKCGSFWKITIRGFDIPVSFELVRKEPSERISFVPAENLFGTSNVTGRKDG